MSLGECSGTEQRKAVCLGLDGKSGTFPKPETHLEVISNTASLPQSMFQSMFGGLFSLTVSNNMRFLT